MKKILPFLFLSAAVCNAQPYQQNVYPHPLSICSSGAHISAHPVGFVMIGSVPGTTPGNPNFYLDRTGPGGNFAPASSLPFASSYMVRGNRSCSTAMPQGLSMAGVDVLDVQASSMNIWFALGGAYEEGSFYTGLNSAGNVVASGFYPFPAGATHPTKPVIVESTTSPTEYYICGSFNLNNRYVTYVNRVKESGGLIASKYYLFQNRSLQAADMVISPYTANDLVIVGQTPDEQGTGTRGFLMHVDANTLAAGAFFEYGHSVASSGLDAFNSITIATSPNLGKGFAIGGITNAIPGAAQVWALKVNTNGSAVLWDRVLQPVTDPAATAMIAIKERFSPMYGFTYYGAVISTQGMMVLKLDDNGLPFVGSGIDNVNEFLYPGVLAQPAVVSDLSLLDNAADDVGIHVYGTQTGTSMNWNLFADAAFNGDADNGASLCTSSSVHTGASWFPGPGLATRSSVITQPGASQCGNFAVITNSVLATLSVLCWSPTLTPAGSNNRTTGITEQKENSYFTASPNPVTDKLEVRLNASEKDEVSIKLYDCLGREINIGPYSSEINNTSVILDLEALHLQSGMYTLAVSLNGEKATQKIIYTGNR